MKTTTLYKCIIGFLILINTGMIAFFILTAPKHPTHLGGPDPKEILQLDKKQNKLFLTSANKHRDVMASIQDSQKQIIEVYFKTLTGTTSISQEDQIIKEWQSLEKKKIEATYLHLVEIKSFLSPSQLNNFNDFTHHITSIMFSNKKKRLPPPKDF